MKRVFRNIRDNGLWVKVLSSACLSLDTILHIAQTEDIRDYAPRLMQCFHKNINAPELQPQLMELLMEIISQVFLLY